MSDCIFAYTALFSGNPEYINIYTQDNGSTIVTVRSQGAQETSKVNIPPGELLAMANAIYRHLGAL